MSIEIQAVLVCDGCGKRIRGPVEHRATRAMHSLWECYDESERDGWTRVSRGRYHTDTHWCKECSDKPMKPVPRKKRIRTGEGMAG